MTRSDDRPAQPLLKDAGQARADSREARRAATLRANLTRRKAQTRAREEGDAPVGAVNGDAPAGAAEPASSPSGAPPKRAP